jgi:type II secretory pathway component PulF
MAFKLENIQNGSPKREFGVEIENMLKKEITFFGTSFSSKKKYEFYNELAVLLKAGITVKDTLQLIKENLKKTNDKIIIEEILNKVINGVPFSDAVFASKQFSEYEYYSVKIGEETGTLAKVCKSLATFFERKNEQKRIIISALTYPCIVLSTAILVVIFMLSFVVPMFQDIFNQNKIELPFLTQVIIGFSNAIKNYGGYLVFGIIALIVFAKIMLKNESVKEIVHNIILKTPIVGKFITKIYLAQFTQAISLLTTAKIPMLNSIQLVKKMIEFIPLKKSLQKVEDSILKGNLLSQSLAGNKMFDDRIISLVKVAEETNQTEFVFNQLNEQYNNEVVQQSKLIATIIEPFIIIIVGLIVGVLLVALYLPMFKLSSVIG